MSTNSHSPITRQLLPELILSLEEADTAYCLVAFILESGVSLLLPSLRAAMARGVDLKILTGDYLFVTEPHALQLLLDHLPQAEMRLWHSHGRSFHPKAYLFETDTSRSRAFIGSSNWSASALTSGIEWNAKIEDSKGIEGVIEQYLRLFYDETTVAINSVTLLEYQEKYGHYHAGDVPWISRWTDAEASTVPSDSATSFEEEPLSCVDARVTLRPAQQDALAALESTYEEGYQKALVVLPTGLGKTYLAGFWARRFLRVLFIAHRDEILQQSLRTFQRIFPERQVAVYSGSPNDFDVEILLASVHTLSRSAHRQRFSTDAFDLLIVDEFHHAAATSYLKVLAHFSSRFLLGLTATPERTDGRDIYGLCDGNLAYQVSLGEAVSEGWLSPFTYYGVLDSIDYTAIRWRGNHYDEDALTYQQTQTKHAEEILKGWRAHRQTRTLAFCSSVRHAAFLDAAFRSQGVKSAFLHAGSERSARRHALADLDEGILEVIFSVDLFNEGVDVPRVDTILMVRPTESSIVFLQQLGRGLRFADSKARCHVIDVVGNYRHAEEKLHWLGIADSSALIRREKSAITVELPGDSWIHLDFAVVEVLKQLIRKKTSKAQQLVDAYHDLRRDRGRSVSYLEFHLYAGVDSRMVRQEFGSYIGLLAQTGGLSPWETELYQEYRGWLEEVERTTMTKSYKMVMLMGMLERGPQHWLDPITAVDVAPFFHHYLMTYPYRRQKDFADKSTRDLWDYQRSRVARLIQEQPMTHWGNSHAGFTAREGSQFRIILQFVNQTKSITLHVWTREIAEYRLHTYFAKSLG